MSEHTGDIPVEAAAHSAPEAAIQLPAAATVEIEQRLRAEYAEISAIAAQAARLGVTIDAAEAMAKGIRPEALRRTVLDQLAERSDATDVVAAAPKADTESPIVRRAREAAARK
jgi:chorismate mutase